MFVHKIFSSKRKHSIPLICSKIKLATVMCVYMSFLYVYIILYNNQIILQHNCIGRKVDRETVKEKGGCQEKGDN